MAERASHVVCPPQDQIFRALQLCPPDRLKVVVVGQDPYHTPGQADGLCFSCAEGRPQPSLENILAELCADVGLDRASVRSTELSGWARQGVLLLNTSLTVAAHSPNSHSGWGWDTFTTAVLRHAAGMDRPMVFMLWGSNARNLYYGLDPDGMPGDRLVLTSSHPSPFSANRASGGVPAFIGSRPFSKANAWLSAHGIAPVDWTAGLV